MKKLLSIALLCSSLIMNANASWQNWVWPVAVPAVFECASRYTRDAQAPQQRSPNDQMTVSDLCRHMADSSGCELGKRVLNSGLSMGYEMGNDWKSVAMDVAINGLSPMALGLADSVIKTPARLAEVMKNPVYRTVLLFACKNVVSSMIPASVPAPAASAAPAAPAVPAKP